jgi:hypothetical protein
MSVCMNKLLGINYWWKFQFASVSCQILHVFVHFAMIITSINIYNTMFVTAKMYVQGDDTAIYVGM